MATTSASPDAPLLGTASPLSDHRAGLGECPVWEPRTARVRWIDAERGAVLSTAADGTTEAIHLPDPPGCIVPTANGGLVCAAGREVFRLGADGPGARLAALPPDDPGRFNDGKCDAAGRLWVGTAVRTGEPACRLYRIDDDGIAAAVNGVRMSNGIGWSPDGSAMYYVDTGAGSLDAFAFENGALGDRRTLLRLEPPLLPDGLAVDATGSIWLAVWGGAEVLRIAPTGAIEARVAVPAAFVTSCAFGGDYLRTLFITTAAGGPASSGQGGGLYTFAPGVSGLSVGAFGQIPLSSARTADP